MNARSLQVFILDGANRCNMRVSSRLVEARTKLVALVEVDERVAKILGLAHLRGVWTLKNLAAITSTFRRLRCKVSRPCP